jgi:dolichol-phosphate mannosyltransferase
VAAVSLVVPTYNERDRLPDLVSALVAVFQSSGIDGEIVVVDDNSPDGTGAIADDLARRDNLRVVHRAGKLGLGTAVIEGFEAASAPVVGVLDGDLSHPPELVPVMLSLLERTGADMIVGSRYIPGGGSRGWPLGRLLLSRAACALARPVTRVVDATSGFFLVRRDAVSNVRIEAGGFKICLELLVRGRIRSVAEIPYVFVGRTAGDSKMNVAEAFGFVRQLANLWLYARRHERPVYRRITPAEVRPAAAPPLTARGPRL